MKPINFFDFIGPAILPVENLNLIEAPEDVMDYIILHELCHLKIKEHSHHYWDLVRKYVPDYQDKEDWLRANAAVLV